MKTLLWLGNPFFCAAMERYGWRVVSHVPARGELFQWDDCVRLAGGEPDLLVVGDTSRPPFVLGVEHFPCRTVFYAVDTHIHSWMPLYGQAFDACLISLKDHIPLFAGKRLPENRLWWSPPYAPDAAAPFPTGEKRWDCLFVGTVDPLRTPLRAHFLTRLAELVPTLAVQHGYFTQFYPAARVAVNICEYGDLNFRVWESMGCGAALVTPAVGHGLTELFQPGRHLLTFDMPPAASPQEAAYADASHDDAVTRAVAAQAAEHAATAINGLLDDPARCEAMARAGWEEVNVLHRARHRAAALAKRLETLPPDLPDARRAQADAIRACHLRLLYLLWSESLPDGPLKTAYLAAARGTPSV